jgi:hypothetical protein
MKERLYGERQSPTYRHELAISATTYDTLLVRELTERLTPRLGVEPVWSLSSVATADDTPHPLANETSRLVLVLHQRLWSRDASTQVDARMLGDRLQARRESVCVVTLDAEPLADWLTIAPACSLSEVGIDGAIAFVLEAIATCGGVPLAPRASATQKHADEDRFERPAPFLEQHRAFSSLRHELDALAAALTAKGGGVTHGAPDRVPELYSLPNRLVVRLGSSGLSFSWIGGGLGTVADGRLLVIEWTGMRPSTRGVTPLQSAIPVRERVYRPEAAGPDGWRWRADHPNGCAYSTAHLAGEWLVGASIASNVYLPIGGNPS